MLLASLEAQRLSVIGTQRLMLINVLLVLLMIGFFATVILALVRRSVRERVEAARLSAMGMATARILHQVKNPLQTILLHAEMLEDERLIADRDIRKEICEAIVGEASRMATLLGELSSYASGIGRNLRLELLPLHTLLRGIISRVGPDAEREGIEVVVGPLEEAFVQGDAQFLPRAVENIIKNAREAFRSSPGGAPPLLELALRRRGEEAVIEVRDNGPGIEAERLGEIFEPFMTTRSKGIGLGLPICREIVEAHGGRVELRSRPGVGTVVSLVLPTVAAVATPL